MTGNIFTELVKGYQKMRAISEMERISIHRLFSANKLPAFRRYAENPFKTFRRDLHK